MIRAIERALRVLDSFDTANSQQSLQRIAARTGLSKATAFRLVNTLVKGGYLMRDARQLYSLTFEVLRLSSLVELDVNIQTVLRPLMADLVRQVTENVALYTASGNNRVCIDAIMPSAPLMRVIMVGEQVPLPQGAIGRTLMSLMTDGEIDDILTETPVRVGKLVLRRRIDLIRHRGYDMARGERVPGATAVVAPIHHRLKNGACYCMAIVGPSERLDERLEELTLALCKTCKRASRELGAS
ncbi:MAG: IclR family transcriptional regulator [Rhizobiales bacterium]|nr:IclR family transcriptional regulator [Hyphomicrobiales bacterium]OJY45846.1 MAG: hypothetical protein BGP08_06485 [Rhizobiales bacterium 64-17]